MPVVSFPPQSRASPTAGTPASPHKLSTYLARRFGIIGIENLNVKGMLGNHCLSRAIADMGFGDFCRQLEYNVAQLGGRVVAVDRWYPSSKTCSNGAYLLEELALSMRSWTCPGYGHLHDCDVNAAINLRSKAVSSTVSAC